MYNKGYSSDNTNDQTRSGGLDQHLRTDTAAMNDILTMFDLDGTLITMWDVHVRAYERTINELYAIPGVNFRNSDYKPGGTYADTARMALKYLGYSDKLIDTRIEDVGPTIIRHYLTANISKTDIVVLPGVQNLLQTLDQNGACICLVTGNSSQVAEMILKASGLADRISFVIGSDSSRTRDGRLSNADNMAQMVMREKYDMNKRYFFDDSDSSIPFSGKLGIKSMAVATGEIPYNTLKAANPYRLLRDLSDTHGVLEMLSAGVATDKRRSKV